MAGFVGLQNLMTKKQYEIAIYGRGGQGAKTTAEVLAQAQALEGKFVQAFPQFGPERTGAPVLTFVRISNKPIITHQPIVSPDCILVLDDTLLALVAQRYQQEKNQLVIINSQKKRSAVAEILARNEFFLVDATGISLKIIGEDRPNTVILGKLAKLSGKISVNSIKKFFQDKYIGKIGKEKTAKNIEAIEEAYRGE